jgi:TIR domain
VRAIFLSYRRDDAEGEAGRLFDDLTSEFGTDRVFMDVAGIEPGRDFRKVIDQNVASCGVLLAMMGKGWIDAKDDAGRRRLDDPVDFVRLETASALRRDIPVIPVLVHGGRMPRSEQLPEDLKDLAYRNAVELTHARWDSDVQVLMKALRPHVSRAGEEPGATGTDTVLDRPSAKSTVPASEGVGGTSSAAPARPTKKIWRGLIVAAVAAMIIAAALVGMNEYKKAEEAKVSRAAAEAAAKQAAEDQRAVAEKEAADRAAKQQAADRTAARRAPEKTAVEQAAARTAVALRNPLVGTWKLNLAKSKYDPGPAPKSLTDTVEAQGDGVKYTVDGVGPAGKSYSYSFAVKFDGKDNPIIGPGRMDETVSVNRIASNNFEFTSKKGGKVTGTFKATVSPDGMVKTINAKGTSADGVKTFDDLEVFDKQ